MLETERSQYTKFPFLFKKICLSRIDDNHKTYDDCKAYNGVVVQYKMVELIRKYLKERNEEK